MASAVYRQPIASDLEAEATVALEGKARTNIPSKYLGHE